MNDASHAESADDQHLRLLSIFHYVVAGLTAVFGCLPIFHIAIGLIMLLAPERLGDSKGEPPPDWFGLVFVAFGGAMMIAFWSFAISLAAAGRCLELRKHYLFCVVMAAIACTCQPWGTILGVFTIIVLMRESVKQLFATSAVARVAPNEGESIV